MHLPPANLYTLQICQNEDPLLIHLAADVNVNTNDFLIIISQLVRAMLPEGEEEVLVLYLLKKTGTSCRHLHAGETKAICPHAHDHPDE